MILIIPMSFLFELTFNELNPFSNLVFSAPKNQLNFYKLFIKMVLPLLSMYTYKVEKIKKLFS